MVPACSVSLEVPWPAENVCTLSKLGSFPHGSLMSRVAVRKVRGCVIIQHLQSAAIHILLS